MTETGDRLHSAVPGPAWDAGAADPATGLRRRQRGVLAPGGPRPRASGRPLPARRLPRAPGRPRRGRQAQRSGVTTPGSRHRPARHHAAAALRGGGPRPAGVGDERYWSWVNTPVFGSDGRVALLLHRVEEGTGLIRAREVALSLQEAMLPAPGPAGHHRAAVRYRPPAGALHVGGDWYDLADLPGGRVAVAVGDVVGHGPPPAGVTGQLPRALRAASRA